MEDKAANIVKKQEMRQSMKERNKDIEVEDCEINLDDK